MIIENDKPILTDFRELVELEGHDRLHGIPEETQTVLREHHEPPTARLDRTVNAYPEITGVREGLPDGSGYRGACLTGESVHVFEGTFVRTLYRLNEGRGKYGTDRTLVTTGELYAWVDTDQLTPLERGCADCEAYIRATELIEKQDGRLICPRCDNKARNLGAARAQLEMFGQQSLI